MMSSVVSSHLGVNSDRSSSSSSRRKKKNKIQHDGEMETNSAIEWKSESQEQMYSCKLVRALHQVRAREARRVREAANRVLAASAKGRSRWSRAILSSQRVKLKFMKKSSMAQGQRKVMSVVHNKSKAGSVVSVRLKPKCLPAFQRKAKLLGRLVPGCRKQPLPVVLEEATDYIAALQMQVRAMSALAELLSVSGATPPT